MLIRHVTIAHVPTLIEFLLSPVEDRRRFIAFDVLRGIDAPDAFRALVAELRRTCSDEVERKSEKNTPHFRTAVLPA
jgi:hypothetical protein